MCMYLYYMYMYVASIMVKSLLLPRTITFYHILAKVLVVKGNLPAARKLLSQAGELFDPTITPSSSIDAYHKVLQSSPTHFQLCTDLLMAMVRLGGEEEEGGGGAAPTLTLLQDLPHLLTTCASSLDQKVSQLCGPRSSPKLPWFSRSSAYLCAELEASLLQAWALSRGGEAAKCLSLCRHAFAGPAKKLSLCTNPRYRELVAHMYTTAGACVVVAKETKAKGRLTKQEDAVEYFLMAFQLCFPYSSALLLRDTCLWLSSSMAEGSPLLASHFLSLGMQLTLTHQAVYSIGQKLR